MATSTTQISPVELTEFIGCSSDDQACAKLFWQSITLHPPIESRLVSGDIRQRLPVAKPRGNYINRSYQPIREPPKLTMFLEVSHNQVLEEESHKLMRQAHKRAEDLHRLHKRKEERMQKEMISHRPAAPVDMDDAEYGDDHEEELSDAMLQLDQFDQKMNANMDRSSDSD